MVLIDLKENTEYTEEFPASRTKNGQGIFFWKNAGYKSLFIGSIENQKYLVPYKSKSPKFSFLVNKTVGFKSIYMSV